MRLLEVDEAANHIRELVDPDANIIWGSAFNPDLEGRIRVSVVATGIDSAGPQKRAAPPQFDLSAVRGPRKPVLAADRTPAPNAAPATGDAPARGGPLSFARFEPEHPAGVPAQGAMPDPVDDASFGTAGEHGFPPAQDEDEDDALELTMELDEPAAAEPPIAAPVAAAPMAQAAPRTQDELLLDEAGRGAGQDERYKPAPAPARRPRMLRGAANEDGGEAAPAKAPASTGSTLFERMANMSRSAPAQEPREESESTGSTMRIPRFLGRQNNQ